MLAIMIPGSLWAASSDDLPIAKTRVKTLAAFKNGLGFVFKSGETDLKDGWAVLDEVPAAALGTLWIGTANPNNRIVEVVSYTATSEKEADAIDFPELLKANVGQKLTVYFSMGGNEPIKMAIGTVLSVPDTRKPEASNPNLPYASKNYGYGSYPYSQTNSGGQISQIVLIKNDNSQIIAINKSSIQAIELPDGATLKTKIATTRNSAKIRFAGDAKSAEIDIAYLEKNITWSPSYLINIKDDKEADITMEAILANDVEDLEDVDVSFVVGYPNFLYANNLTPLLAQQSVDTFLQGLINGKGSVSSGGYGNLVGMPMAYNGADYQSTESWRPESAYTAPHQPILGETNEDLYFYRQPHVTLKKGDRARYTIFTNRVPYEDLYQWTVTDTMQIDDSGYGNRSNQPKTPNDQVWHTLQLENTGNQPWTTAPAFVVNGSLPIAQDVLKYTPSKGKNILKLTLATDVLAQQSQVETSRTQNGNYDNVMVDGELSIKSFKSQTIKMSVLKSLRGVVIQASDNGIATKVVKNIAAANPNSEIVWEFDLAPGAEKTLTYKYNVLVHR